MRFFNYSSSTSYRLSYSLYYDLNFSNGSLHFHVRIFLHFHEKVPSLKSKVALSGLSRAPLFAWISNIYVRWPLGGALSYGSICPHLEGTMLHRWQVMKTRVPLGSSHLLLHFKMSHQCKRRTHALPSPPLPATRPVPPLDWKIMCFTASVLYVNVRVSMPEAWHTGLNLWSLQEPQQWPLPHDCRQRVESSGAGSLSYFI